MNTPKIIKNTLRSAPPKKLRATNAAPHQTSRKKHLQHWTALATWLSKFLTAGLTFLTTWQFWLGSIPPYLFATNVLFLIVFFHGLSGRCKQCGTFWSVRTVNLEPLEQWNQHQDVIRKDVHRNPKGEIISTTDRLEQVVVSKTRYRHDQRCLACGCTQSAEYIR
ncbi:MAG: hypothetical protein NTX39_03035 [Opitutae bacterium]|nr:hypothetical protein [Opitutae bacterium]